MEICLTDTFKIHFRDNSLSIFDENKSQYYYTLQYGLNSKIADFHKTYRTPIEGKKHEPIFAIRHFSIGRIFVWIKSLENEIINFVLRRQILISELWALDYLVNPINDDYIISEVLKISKRGKKLETKKNVPVAVLNKIGLTTKEIKINNKMNAYTAFQIENGEVLQKGIILTLPREKDPFHVIYISMDRVEQIVKRKTQEFKNILGPTTTRIHQLRLLVELRSNLGALFN